jgi:plasmid stability protein
MVNIDLEHNLQFKLKQRAKQNGRSIEQEIIEILSSSLDNNKENSLNLAERINLRFAEFEDINIPETTRDKMRNNIDFNS